MAEAIRANGSNDDNGALDKHAVPGPSKGASPIPVRTKRVNPPISEDGEVSTSSEVKGKTRVAHIHKLERKHSSGDLHSRLKTRKLLGVGETDDGDVHRSKLSQILGHSEQLYIKLPRGLRIWHFILAVMFLVMGVWAVVFPTNLLSFALHKDVGVEVRLPIRLYGAALLGLSVIFWSTVQATDRDVIRWSLLASLVYFTIQILVCVLTLLPTHPGKFGTWFFVSSTFGAIATSLYFYFGVSNSRAEHGKKGH